MREAGIIRAGVQTKHARAYPSRHEGVRSGRVPARHVFPVARQRNVKLVIGSSLNAGFISGSPRYNYGKTSWDIPRQYIEKGERLRTVAVQFGAFCEPPRFSFLGRRTSPRP